MSESEYVKNANGFVRIDPDKIQTLEDVLAIVRAADFAIGPANEHFEKLRHMFKIKNETPEKGKSNAWEKANPF